MSDNKEPEYQFDVSCIIPAKNCANYLRQCVTSLLHQKCSIRYEICIHNDGSDDGTSDVIDELSSLFNCGDIPLKSTYSSTSNGVGYAKNRAIKLSSGRFLCFCDADDISLPTRLQKQYDAFMLSAVDDKSMIGSQFSRLPKCSTPRYTSWACDLDEKQLYSQIYTSFGPTIIAPTWFITRVLYEKVNGFNERYKSGFSEDLDFFYRALNIGATIIKINEPLLIYRYHDGCSTHAVSENTIWDLRIVEIEKNVLSKWSSFTIWNAGKQGKRFFRSLSDENKAKVIAICDVDENKIRKGKFQVYDERLRKVMYTVPIIHHRNAKPPVIVCVKLNLTDGSFEKNLMEKDWREGVDFFHFN